MRRAVPEKIDCAKMRLVFLWIRTGLLGRGIRKIHIVTNGLPRNIERVCYVLEASKSRGVSTFVQRVNNVMVVIV